MQALDKILTDIDAEIEKQKEADGSLVGTSMWNQWVKGMQRAKDIIRKHMNDGWIPVEERLPEKYGKYLVTVLPPAGRLWIKVFIAHFSDLMGIIKNPIFYMGNVGKNDFKDITDEVIAWQPLPEPFKAERSE